MFRKKIQIKEKDSRLDFVLKDTVDNPDCHAEWSKLDRERQISYDIIFTWDFLKRVQMNLLTEKK